jgi:hypothetical protein
MVLSWAMTWILYSLFGHQLIEVINRSESLKFLHRIVERGTIERFMFAGSFVTIIVCALTVCLKALCVSHVATSHGMVSPLSSNSISGKFATSSRKWGLVESRRRKRMDAAIAGILVIGAAFGSLSGASCLTPILSVPRTSNTWFEADIPRVYANMTDRESDHYMTRAHPLFSLISYPLVYSLRKMPGINSVMAATAIIALNASLWIGALFILMRLGGCRRFDAVLFTLMGAVSAAAVFWFAVPETYSFGSVSILVGLAVVGLAKYRSLPASLYITTSALTLSVTVTNWMIGILATLANNPWKRALKINLYAFCIVVLLWGLQKLIFPSAGFFIGYRHHAINIATVESGGMLYVAASFLLHTMVMPDIKVIQKFDQPGVPMMRVQRSLPGSGSRWGAIAVVLWAGLVILGVWALFTVKEHRQLRIVLGAALLAQLALHVLYGEETFLYALHFSSLLVPLAAFSTQTRARPLALSLAAAVVVCAGINNGLQFSRAIGVLRSEFRTADQASIPGDGGRVNRNNRFISQVR